MLDSEDRWPCYWAMQTMSITDTGKVVTCAVDLDAKFIAGDMNQQSLKEVWSGELKASGNAIFLTNSMPFLRIARNAKTGRLREQIIIYEIIICVAFVVFQDLRRNHIELDDGRYPSSWSR